MITRIISIRRTLGVVMLTIATAAVCPEPARSEPIEPKAELKLEIPHHERASGESFDFVLTITNTGKVPIPVIDDKGFGIISTRQLFIVSTILEMNPNRPLQQSALQVGDNHPVGLGPAELSKALQFNAIDEIAKHHAGYLGGPHTADWQRVIDQETKLLQPGEELIFTAQTVTYHDRPIASRFISSFNWQFWFLIGDGIWAKSNVITFDIVDLDVESDSEIIRSFPRTGAEHSDSPARAYHVRRLVVDDEQWIYFHAEELRPCRSA